MGKDTSTASAEDGSFAFEKMIASRYGVVAYKDEMYAAMVSVHLSETSEPIILRMRRGATLVAHVNGDNGPLGGAKVVLDGAVEALSAADGAAYLHGLGPHFHAVDVAATGYAPASFSLMINDDPGGTVEQTITLHRGAPMSGFVLGPNGRPIPEASVDISALSGADWSGRASTNKSGAWKFDALAAGRYQLRASSETYGPAAPVAIDVDGVTPRTGVIVPVAYDAQIVGNVYDMNGKPVTDCVTRANASMNVFYDARSDANGRFEMLGILAGDYDVFCVKAGLSSPSVRVNVANGERVAVRLVVDEGSIAGVVVDTSGDPVSEAPVRAMALGRLASFGDDTTDSNGRFDLGGLPPGEYLVSATWPDQEDRRLAAGRTVQTGERNVMIVLSVPASLTGRVLLEGKPLPYYGVLVTDHPEFSFMGAPMGVRSGDGRFTVRNVDPGTWGVVIMGPGTARKTIAGIKVEAGKVTDLGDVAMDRGQRITGHVFDAGGHGVSGASVCVGGESLYGVTTLQRSFSGTFETKTDATGRFAFEGIAPLAERARISASHPKLGASVPSALPPGDGVIDLRLLPAGGIDGFIEGATDATIMSERAGDRGGMLMTHTNAAGEFHFDGLVPGEYSVSLGATPGQVGASTFVTVIANQRAKAKLTVGEKRILLIVNFVGGTCHAILLKAVDSSAAGQTGSRLCTQGKAEFEIAPGNYQACPDGKGCVLVTVADTPGTQAVEVRATTQ